MSSDALGATPVRWTPGDLSRASSQPMARPASQPAESAAEIAARLADVARQTAEQEQAQRVDEAYSSGYDEGRLAGEIAEGVRLRNAVQAAERALADIRDGEVRWQENVSENIAALATAIARQIVGRELRTDAAAIADLVRRALAEFPIDQPMRIRVNPVDLSLLTVHTSPDGEPVPIAPNRDIHWLADARIAPGGCIVEGRERIIDGRVDTGLERLYRRLSATNA